MGHAFLFRCLNWKETNLLKKRKRKGTDRFYELSTVFSRKLSYIFNVKRMWEEIAMFIIIKIKKIYFPHSIFLKSPKKKKTFFSPKLRVKI